MCELGDNRVGVECDGPTHFDSTGADGASRSWSGSRSCGAQVGTLSTSRTDSGCVPRARRSGSAYALAGWTPTDSDDQDEAGDLPPSTSEIRRVSEEADAVFRAVKGGAVEEEDVLREARDLLGRKRLTSKLRLELQAAALQMNHSGLLVIEEGQYFLTTAGRGTTTVGQPAPAALPRRRLSKSQASGRRNTPHPQVLARAVGGGCPGPGNTESSMDAAAIHHAQGRGTTAGRRPPPAGRRPPSG